MILVVEDDKFYSENIKDILQFEGVDALVADGPDMAISILNKRHTEIELVVLDVMMLRGSLFSEIETKGGYQTGIVLGTYIKKEFPHIKIVGASSSGSEDVIKWFSKFGVAYFHKPLSLNDLKIIAKGEFKTDLSDLSNILELKPNVFGIGVDLKVLWGKFTEWRKR